MCRSPSDMLRKLFFLDSGNLLQPPGVLTMSRRRSFLPMDTEWMANGKCRELPPQTFFPSDGVGVDLARRICADCPVQLSCLEYALYNRIDHGVWGGASERERRRIARRRRSAPVGID